MNGAGHPRQDIYYWKCDRPAAFHALHGPGGGRSPAELQQRLEQVLPGTFPGEPIALQPGPGQGNHATLTGRIGARDVFIRIDDGPEDDDYLEVESHVLKRIAQIGVPAPRVFATDASRSVTPFAWQVLERIPYSDLNHHAKAGTLKLRRLAREIGAYIAHWQSITPAGFGPCVPAVLREQGVLRGFHPLYDRYFYTRLERHLDFLVAAQFLTGTRAREIHVELNRHRALLASTKGVLVHKDLALWNILGGPAQIAAFIDWDDVIVGDALDDISLLGCFHDGAVIGEVLEGYASVRPLPGDYRTRFWLHLLRNIVTKAVIRVGAGYFERADSFFLIGSGGSGTTLRQTTLQRIDAALAGLKQELDPVCL